MRLTSAELSGWAEPLYKRFDEKLTWTRVAGDADFSGVTISVQRAQNQVDAQIIVNVARKRGLEPLEQLSQIPRWKHLAETRSAPSQSEILASLHPAHALREISDRLLVLPPNHANFEPWDSYRGRFSTWVDVAGPDDARKILRTTLKLSSVSSLSTKLNSRSKFRVDEAIDGFAAAGMNSVFALVLASKLTPQEAGYPDTIREDALLSISDEDLLHLNQKQVRYMRQILSEYRVSEEHLRKLQ